jgi:hypothetical protein
VGTASNQVDASYGFANPMTAVKSLRRLYNCLPPAARELLKVVAGSAGHRRSVLDRLKALDHAVGKKRLDVVCTEVCQRLDLAGIDTIRDWVVLEFGAGYCPTEVLVFLLLGARRVYAVDCNPIAQLTALQRSVRAAPAGSVEAALSDRYRDFDCRKALSDMVRLDSAGWQEFLAARLVYLAPFDLARNSVGEPIDLIDSIHVLEHIPPCDVQATLTGLRRDLSVGRSMIHDIDLRDHRDFDRDPLGFLRRGDDFDAVRDTDRRGNMLRRDDWLRAFAGDIQLDSRCAAQAYTAPALVPRDVREELAGRSITDLSCSRVLMVGTRLF